MAEGTNIEEKRAEINQKIARAQELLKKPVNEFTVDDYAFLNSARLLRYNVAMVRQNEEFEQLREELYALEKLCYEALEYIGQDKQDGVQRARKIIESLTPNIREIVLEKTEPKYVKRTMSLSGHSDMHKSNYGEEGASIISEKIKRLMESCCAFEPIKITRWYTELYRPNHPDGSYDKSETTTYVFAEHEECSLAEQQSIREREAIITRIKNDPTTRFDEPGRIRIPISLERLEQLYGGYILSDFDESEYQSLLSREGTGVTIEATPRELAEAGILYEDLGWESSLPRSRLMNGKVLKREIAQMGKEMGITPEEASGGKIRQFIDRVLKRTKDNAKGREE